MTNAGSTSWGAATPQGPGWWQASDGLWYPPQPQPPPAATAPQPAAPAPQLQPQPQPVVQVPVQGYQVQHALAPGEVRLSYDRPVEQVGRLRPLYVGFLLIPAFFTMLGVVIVAAFSTYAAFFGTLFLGRVHPRSHANIVRAYRYQWRLTTYALCWRSDRPQPGPATTDDQADDPARLTVAYGGEGLSRLGPIVKPFLAIPKLIVLFFKMIGAYIAMLVGLCMVVVKGEFPQAQRDSITRVYFEATQLNAWLVLSDRRPD